MPALRLHPLAVLLAAGAFAAQLAAQQRPNPDLGFTDTPMLPNLPWHVHDPARPYPPVVQPGPAAGAAPSDAIVLFDGKDLSHWAQHTPDGKLADPKWPLRDGYFECAA